jgi:hypothetical protein
MPEVDPAELELSELGQLVDSSAIPPGRIDEYVAPDMCDDAPERFEILSALLDDRAY